MRATTILAIVGIVSALGAAPSLIHIQQVSAQFFQGSHSPPGKIVRGDLGIVKGDLGALRGKLDGLKICIPDCGP
jgi:hypothetical protein